MFEKRRLKKELANMNKKYEDKLRDCIRYGDRIDEMNALLVKLFKEYNIVSIEMTTKEFDKYRFESLTIENTPKKRYFLDE